MPELPEAETVRRELEREASGRVLEEVQVLEDDILLNAEPAAFARAVEGRRIHRVGRRGKWPLLFLDPDRVVETQLRMTGRFVVSAEPPDPSTFSHVAATFRLDDGRTLYYDDRRRLGGFNLWTAAAWEERSAGLGPEPLGPGFTADHLGRVLEGRRAPVKNLLMDAGVVAGVGNVYAAEALHRSRLDPRRLGGELEPAERERLRESLVSVLEEGLAHGGTSFSDFRDPAGEPGGHQRHLAVYGREGEDCPRCGREVSRIRQAGRSTYFCPGCQR